MQLLSRYFAEQNLRKIRIKLKESQQPSIDTLISMLNSEGKVNFNSLRDALTPLASSTNSANTMLRRFLARIDEVAKEAGMAFKTMSTANKNAGNDRWVWFEGLAEAATKPYTGDLNSIPEAVRMDDQRGLPIGRPVILITFNEHETREVLSAFSATERSPENDGIQTFTRLGIHGGQEVIHVISNQGRKSAQHTATLAIKRHYPSAVIGVGIAFGAQNGKRHIGDVLVSEYLFDYESARLNSDGTIIYRGPRPPATRQLVERIRDLVHRRSEQINWPKVFIGPLVCGDKLVDNKEFIKKLQTSEPELIGGEMEGSGIEVAASAANVSWIVVKGISDWGDGTKNTPSKDDDQRTAARNAVIVVKAMLEIGPFMPASEKITLPTPAQPLPTPQPQQDCHPPSAVVMGLRDLNEVLGATVDDEAKGLPARMDFKNSHEPIANQTRGESTPENEGVAVIPYLRQWLLDPGAPPLFALLGEYGMGKTISCQLLAKQLDEERRSDITRPIPLYFDLRHITGLRERVPKLHEALEECMSRGWLDDGQGYGYTLANIHRWVQQGAVVIFDGLDEVLVKLTEADGRVFTNNLLKLIADAKARAKAEGRHLQLKVLVTCRTQYFPNLQAQNSHFTQSERGEFTSKSYRALVLLPWTEGQVRRYLSHALPELDLDQLLDIVRSVHNLQEMTQRPYTLKLITEFIPDIEKDRAEGRTVYGVSLYRKMVEKWLARDSGKHHIKPEHKLRLASHLAVHLWRTGRNALPAEELNSWFHEWLATETDIGRRYNNLHPDQLEEDLRTATFLARQDEREASSFRFAHTSLLEYFLARYLFNAIERNDVKGWAIPIPSQETLNFVGQLLGEASNLSLLNNLQSWQSPYTFQATELLLAYTLLAQRGRWPAPLLKGLDLRGANLRSWALIGEKDHYLDLSGACLNGSDLRESRFQWVILDNAEFVGADLSRSNLLDCSIRAANFQSSQITATIFRRCKLEGSEWNNSHGYRPQWLNCTPQGVSWQIGDNINIEKPIFAPTIEERNNEQLAWLLKSYITSFAFAPTLDSNGRNWMAAGNQLGAISLIDLDSGEVGAVLSGHQGYVSFCTFSRAQDSAGRYWFASTDHVGKVRLWDLRTGEAGPVLDGHEGRVWECAFAPALDKNGRLWLASAGQDRTLRLWDVESGEAGPILGKYKSEVLSCAFAQAPDGSGSLWLASGNDDGTVRLWDVATAKLIRMLPGHKDSVRSCAFAPIPDSSNRLWLASASDDRTVRLWDATTGEAGPVMRGHEGPVSSCAFSPIYDDSKNLRLVSTGLDGTARIWDVPTGNASLVIHAEDEILFCAFSQTPDRAGRYWLATLVEYGDVRFWDTENGQSGAVIGSSYGSRFWSCAFPKALGDSNRPWFASTGLGYSVQLWSTITGKAGRSLVGHELQAWSCTFSSIPDEAGQYWLASASSDQTVRLWNALSGEAGPIFRGHEQRVWDCAFAPALDRDGRLWLASVSSDGTLRLWDVASGEAGPILCRYKNEIVSCSFTQAPDGSGNLLLATGSINGSVRLWDVSTGKLIQVLRGHKGPVRSCAFAPIPDSSNRLWLATAGDDTVRLWDSSTGKAGPVMRGHGGQVWDCTFAPTLDNNGKLWLASSGYDGTVKLWDTEKGEAGPVLRGHIGNVRSCSFTASTSHAPNQLSLISAGNDGTLRLWDVPNGRCIRITAVCSSPKGHAIWEPESNHILEVTGGAWRHLAWLRPLPDAIPERLPLEFFGPIPSPTTT